MAKNEREILREWTTIVSAIDEGAGLDMVKAVGKKAGKYAPVGLGVGFGVADAADRLSDKDYTGAGIAGLSAAAAMVPGPGTAVAGALDAYNIARDEARDAGGFKELLKKLQPSVSSAEQMPMEEHDVSEGLPNKLFNYLGKEAPAVAKKIDPTFTKPKITMKSGETMDQAIARNKAELAQAANVDNVASKAAAEKGATATTNPATGTKPAEEVPQLTRAQRKQLAKDNREINDIEAGRPTTALGKVVKGAWDNPWKTGIATTAATVAANKKEGETWADTTSRMGGELGKIFGKTVASAGKEGVNAVADELAKDSQDAENDPKQQAIRNTFKAADDEYAPGGARNPLPDGAEGLQETRIFTQHPVTGQIVQLNVNNISRVVNQTFYESYECGAGDSAQWQCQIWSSTPVSKLLKGRS